MLSRWRYSWRILDDNEAQKMKKTAIAIAVALAGFATVAQAAPKDNTWYTGAKLGWSQYHDTGFIDNNGPTHENQLGAGAFGGYQVNPVSYTHLDVYKRQILRWWHTITANKC